MKKIIISTTISFIVGVILCGALFLLFKPRPGPLNVIENPTKKQEKKADVVLVQEKTGNLHGESKLTQKYIQHEPQSGKVGQTDPGVTNDTPKPTQGKYGLFEGDVVKVPVSGEVKTTYIDKKTGKQIGQGVHPISGETVVTVEGDKIIVDTMFNDFSTVAIDLPEPKSKTWHVGAGINFDDDLGYRGYIQKDFKAIKTKWIDLQGVVRVDVIKDIEKDKPYGLYFAGVEFNF